MAENDPTEETKTSREETAEKQMGKFEEKFETALWSSRFIVLLAVVFGLISAVVLFVVGSFNIIRAILYHFQNPVSGKLVGSIIGAVDLYLIGVVLLIFSFGIYELFISHIDIGRKNNEVKILEIQNLDDLKNRIIKVVIMVLVVTFFKKVSDTEFNTALEMLYFAGSIFAISFGVYFMHKHD